MPLPTLLAFDTYGKRSYFAKTADVVLLATVALIITLLLCLNNATKAFQNFLLLAIFMLLAAGVAMRVMMHTPGGPAAYVKDGDIAFNEDGVAINAHTYTFEDVKRIDVLVAGYNGQPGAKTVRDGVYNTIWLHFKPGTVLKKHFFIASGIQQDSLHDLLFRWKSAGFKIHVTGLDIRQKSTKPKYLSWKNEDA